MWDELYDLVPRGVNLPPGSAQLFSRYYELLVSGNQKANLTRILEPRQVMVKHFVDSLALLSWRSGGFAGPLLDVGSGAGLPGIPLKIARPELEVRLLDSARKRVDFLRAAAGQLGLSGLDVVYGRAEELARQEGCRDSFPLVVSRALARLPVLLELCLPFVRPGGYFVAYKGPEAVQELSAAGAALDALGAVSGETFPYSLPDACGERCLLIFVKTAETPSRYPRRAGLPEKRPLA
jgi:16S rRNA (guanine527-N7)-methyltransferase